MSRYSEKIFDEIVKEAVEGRVDCCFMFNLLFNTKFTQEKVDIKSKKENFIIPTLIINNKDKFYELLDLYLIKARVFYNDDSILKDIKQESNSDYVVDKSILTLLWSNATYEDFSEPIKFLYNRINFFDNYFEELNSYLGYSEILGANINIKISKEKIINEAPYRFEVILDDSKNKYIMPELRFGISNGECYITAIQRETKNEENKFTKCVNRKLFQIGEGFDPKEDNFEIYGTGNLKDVSASFVVTANIFLGLLKKYNIRKIVLPSIYIERWNAKEIANEIKKQHLTSKNVAEDKINQISEDDINEHIRIQSNLTEKFIRTFLRLAHHHSGFNLNNDINSYIIFNIDDMNECNNSLLDETFKLSSKNDNIRL